MLRLKELRTRHDPPLTQEQLAVKAGVGSKTVRRAEGGGEVTTTTLSAFARALGVPITALFEDA